MQRERNSLSRSHRYFSSHRFPSVPERVPVTLPQAAPEEGALGGLLAFPFCDAPSSPASARVQG